MPGELGFDTGPFVNVAAFCERVLREQDQVISLIRLVDQVTVTATGPAAPRELPAGATVQTTLVVSLKPGAARGSHAVRVDLRHPDMSVRSGPQLPVHFNAGEASGANIILPMVIELSDAGLYWAEVYFNDRLLTRVPLQVNYGAIPTPPPAPRTG